MRVAAYMYDQCCCGNMFSPPPLGECGYVGCRQSLNVGIHQVRFRCGVPLTLKVFGTRHLCSRTSTLYSIASKLWYEELKLFITRETIIDTLWSDPEPNLEELTRLHGLYIALVKT